MASTQALKSRIKSVKNTKQITKAMQLVAASKMRRAQEADKASAPYVQAASELLAYFAGHGFTDEHPLFKLRQVKSRLLVVISADKGLAGAYNTNIMKAYIKELKADDSKKIANKTIAIGRRGIQFASRIADTEILGAYENLPDKLSGAQFHAIMDTIFDLYTSGEVDAVDVVYTKFISSINQEVRIERILPAGVSGDIRITEDFQNSKFEPSAQEVLDGVAHRLVGAQFFQALLDARASEHSMRMVAMKNATDNASDLVEDLTLEMNKARQAAITQEIAEISGGVEAAK